MTQHTTTPGTSAPSAGATPTTAGTSSETSETTSGATSLRGGRTPGLPGRSVAEGAGSFLVVLVGLGATMLATEVALQPSLVFGFAVVAAMIAFGHVSGGHFNPAITLGSAVAGRTAWKAVLPYVVAQLIGAIAAAGLIWLVLSSNSQLTTIDAFFGSASNGFEDHSPTGFPLTSAFLIEVVAAAVLVAVFLGAGARGAVRGLAPVAVGLTYAGLISFLLPVTNGGINPIRSAASALFAESWALEQLWLFWAAPILGGVIAGLVYRSVDWASADARVDEAPVDGDRPDRVTPADPTATATTDAPDGGAPATTSDSAATADAATPSEPRGRGAEERRNAATAGFFEQPTAERQAPDADPASSDDDGTDTAAGRR